jgi:hypothetical protein
VVNAVSHYLRQVRRPLPHGQVVEYEAERSPPGLHLVIRPDGEERNHAVRLSSEALAAAMVLYCRYRKVPLPAKAAKILTVSGDRFVLMVGVGLTEAEKKFLESHPMPVFEIDSSAEPDGGAQAVTTDA